MRPILRDGAAAVLSSPCASRGEVSTPRRSLRRAHRREEVADLILQRGAVAGERLGGGEDLRRGRAGFGRAALHVGDVRRDLLGALRGLLDVARDFLGGGTLLLDRGGDGGGD